MKKVNNLKMVKEAGGLKIKFKGILKNLEGYYTKKET
jgi:hypothetical protein